MSKEKSGLPTLHGVVSGKNARSLLKNKSDLKTTSLTPKGEDGSAAWSALKKNLSGGVEEQVQKLAGENNDPISENSENHNDSI